MHPAYLLFGCFFFLLFAGVPIAASLGLAGTFVIAVAGLGIMAVPTNVYAGIAKYPLLAIPMFVLAGAIYRTLTLRDIFQLLVESAETSAVILIVVGLAGIFAWASSTLGIVDPIARGLVSLGGSEAGVLLLLMIFLVIVGMFLDGISIFLIFTPLFIPIAQEYHWDLVWFGVLMTYNVALGQFTPPMAVNLMVSCRLTGTPMESTIRWVVWLLLAMFLGLVLIMIFPGLAVWLPQVLGFM